MQGVTEQVHQRRSRFTKKLNGPTRTSPCSPSIFHRPFHFTAGFPILDGLTAIMLLLSFGQADFDLGEAPLGEINAERDERKSLLLRFAKELVDLLAVEEQLPGAERFVIRNVAVAVGTDMAMMEKNLVALHTGITVLQVHPPFAQRFNLRALKHDARLELLFNKIVMVRLPIRDHRLFKTVLLFPHEASDFHDSEATRSQLSAYQEEDRLAGPCLRLIASPDFAMMRHARTWLHRFGLQHP